MYNSYLTLLRKIKTNSYANIALHGREISVKKNKNWVLSTTVFSHVSRIPQTVRECVSLKLQNNTPFLELDEINAAIYLRQEVPPLDKYLPFKEVMDQFLHSAKEWEEILSDISYHG